MSTHKNRSGLKKDFESLFKPRSEKAETKHDAYMLMASFMSEIEYLQEQEDISRKELANKIKTSASYLTQVFRSKKPLNFVTLAKIKRALNITFEIKAIPISSLSSHQSAISEYRPISIHHFAKESLSSAGMDAVAAPNSIFHTEQGKFTVIPAKNIHQIGVKS